MKVVINDCHGGFGLSHEAYKYLNIPWDNYGYEFERDRANPDLVRCVEALGAKANGHYARLKIVEIPDGVDWIIEEYDGREWVAENHRTWS